MRAFRRCSLLAFAGVCLLMTSCDSKEPISDPQTANIDPALLGVWRTTNKDGSVEYQQVGRAGGKLSEGILRTIGVNHRKDRSLSDPEDFLFFCSEVGKSRFLNVIMTNQEKDIDKLQESGWNAKFVGGYWFAKYEVQGDTLTVWGVDDNAKRRAIEKGTIKGKIEKDKNGNESVYFTDSSKNLAIFLASPGGAKLFDKEPIRYRRVK
jgi:hypothetical protein